jgi:hypothetical protein
MESAQTDSHDPQDAATEEEAGWRYTFYWIGLVMFGFVVVPILGGVGYGVLYGIGWLAGQYISPGALLLIGASAYGLYRAWKWHRTPRAEDSGRFSRFPVEPRHRSIRGERAVPACLIHRCATGLGPQPARADW